MREAIAWFADVGLADRPTVGGKGASLGELTRAGIAVPPGFVVTTRAFELFLAALEARAPVRARIETCDADDLDAVTALSQEMRTRVVEEPLPPEVEGALLAAHHELCGGDGAPVAVRSSATTEDAADASFAGLQDTFLWVIDPADLVARVRECWGSLYSVESITYRRRQAFPESGVAMAVVVQRMVDASVAGVMFTRSPTTGDKSVVTIEGAWGLGSSVVSGEVTPDRWVIGKITGEISTRDISDKHIEHRPVASGGVEERAVPDDRRRIACVDDATLQQLREIGRKVERHYGAAQDIEWAVDRDGRVLLLQSRPETIWSNRTTAPVAAPTDNPFAHVLGVFGRRP
ncbi:PEP/pyruvate-binding domain-containing protein [Sphingomonas sp. SUN019]|uniref:PEP/pyruvate-binding domain-containing protein n=1 Tax=Sphingomonas sp. SUN019 TaxID=2937788 RepID=UPI0021640817|nr:PEP/pyruvate-binding domain-containing protein [Sphingomonas sp. SUN019]UVO50659.1 PEP/pyruvate-binding domain-containing protein [Sphingomonas sp. SUN019]